MAVDLYLQQRIANYRMMADEAETFAKESLFLASREQYQELAREWRKLAADLEKRG